MRRFAARRPHVGELFRAKDCDEAILAGTVNNSSLVEHLRPRAVCGAAAWQRAVAKTVRRCHSVGRTGASPNRLAPPFRSFSETKLYDSDFIQRLQNGLTSIHPFMPTFRFNRDNAEEALNYMKSIQEPPKPK
jgi:hypothetical protein